MKDKLKKVGMKLASVFDYLIEVRIPRTHRGWRELFWLSLERCPQCRSRLFPRIHKTRYDQGASLYCLSCDTPIYPRGLCNALLWDGIKKRSYKARMTRLLITGRVTYDPHI